MSLRPITCGTLDKNIRGAFGVQISDAPMAEPLPFGREWLDYWRQASDSDPEGTMNEVLRCMNMVRDRKPFDREMWTELAEMGQKVLALVSPRLRDGFLRVTSHDKKRRIDALRVCNARMTILSLLAQKSPACALRRVARELGTLPYVDTAVRSDRALRKLTPTQDEWKLYGIYRLNLEVLYAELVLKTRSGVEHRDIILWGIADAAHTAAEKCMECRNGRNDQLDIPVNETFPEELNGQEHHEQECAEELVAV